MVPFFYLHAEVATQLPLRGKKTWPDRRENKLSLNHEYTWRRPRQPAITCLSLFGKDELGDSLVVRIYGYRIQFYVSFKDTQLGRYCCSWLVRQDARDRLVVSIESVSGYKSMLIDKNHQIAASNDYADTTLMNVFRIRVRTRQDVAATIAAIDEKVYDYYSPAGGAPTDEYTNGVRFYESNLDVITAATRRFQLDACRWKRLNTTLCDCADTKVGGGGGGREFVFYDGGELDPALLFSDDTSSSTVSVASNPAPRVKLLAFDIECLSSNEETMPDAVRDPIIQISTVVSEDALGGDTKAAAADEGPLSAAYSFRRRLYTTGGTCDPITGVAVYAFSHEKDMLQAFVDYIFDEDPDIVTGYNVGAFDFPYLFKRLEANSIAARLGKVRELATCKKRGCGESARQYASFIPKTHDTNIPGRVIFDMYTHVRKEVSLRSYTLNSVSAHFLGGRQKDDIGYKEIPHLFNGNGESRARLGRYCVKDAQLVLEIAFQTQTFVHMFERCKVFRTMLQYMIDRGQQARFYSLLLAWCSPLNILVDDVTTRQTVQTVANTTTATAGSESAALSLDGDASTIESCMFSNSVMIASERQKQPARGLGRKRKISIRSTPSTAGKKDSGTCISEISTTDDTNRGVRDGGGKSKKAGYDGATVLEPITGIYYTPVICLDYASLYPSIMIAHNLCFTTLIKDDRQGADLARLGLAEQSPIGYYFLSQAVKKGVLPSILEMLLDERAMVRKQMSTVVTVGTMEYRILDGQQWALKIAANSIYGAIGCDKSLLNFVQIPSSVTAYGRRLIELTTKHVQSSYSGTRVVYGDTDSVMVNLERWDSTKQHIWECAAIGKHMADSTTRVIARPPIRLQFETVYRPFLLCSKKRYAAGVYNDLERIAAAASALTDTNVDKSVAIPPCRSTLKYKGLQVVRRDNCTFATRLMRFTLETLMDEKQDAIRRVTDGLRNELTSLFDGHVNTKELVISKEWKKKCTNAQPHDTLARRMQERDPNSAPRIGDRVPYLVVTVPNGAKLCDRAEDPVYAAESGLQPDYLYYADNQVATPIAALLRVVKPDCKSLEELKDSFWPTNAPRRDTDKRHGRNGAGEKRWMKRAAVGNRRLTDYFKAVRTDERQESAIRSNVRQVADE